MKRFGWIIGAALAFGGLAACAERAAAQSLLDRIVSTHEEWKASRRAAWDAHQAKHQAHLRHQRAHKEACRHHAEMAADANIDRSLHAKLGVGVTYRIRFEQPQIDLEKMKAKIEEVDKRNKLLKEMHAQIHEQRTEEYLRKYEDYLRARLKAEEQDCHLKLPCPPPELPAQIPPPEQQAMLPTEIPIQIPATMEVGFGPGPEFEEARIRELPAKLPCEKPPCECGCPKCRRACDEASRAGGYRHDCPDGKCRRPSDGDRPEPPRPPKAMTSGDEFVYNGGRDPFAWMGRSQEAPRYDTRPAGPPARRTSYRRSSEGYRVDPPEIDRGVSRNAARRNYGRGYDGSATRRAAPSPSNHGPRPAAVSSPTCPNCGKPKQPAVTHSAAEPSHDPFAWMRER